MRKLFLVLLFVLVIAGTVAMNTPLEFVLEKSGAKRLGLNWDEANGTWRTGRLTGVQYAGQPIGNINLDLQPAAFLAGQVAYDVDWQGSPGRGTGKVSIGRTAVKLNDINGQVQFEALRYLVDEVRASGARLTLQDGQIAFVDGACQEASGRVSSDVLTRMAAPYRQDASQFIGDIACDGDMLELFGSGSIGEAGSVTGNIRMGINEMSTLRVEISGADGGLGIALLDYGFEPSELGYMFEHSFQFMEGLQ